MTMKLITKSTQRIKAANKRYQDKHTNPILKRLANEVTAERVKDLEQLKRINTKTLN